MIDREWTIKKGAKRIYLYTACIILIVISIFGVFPQGQYFIGIATLFLPIIYLYTDIKILLTHKKVLSIIPFQLHHQEGIDKLMPEIESEFEERMYSPNAKTISELSYDKNQKFWVAMTEDVLVGTVGICKLGNNNASLKRLMVAKEMRGNKNISKQLLDTTIAWAKKNKIKTIYLGTMSQMKAAMRFYEKHGFTRITHHDLPKDFSPNPVDTIFYRMDVTDYTDGSASD